MKPLSLFMPYRGGRHNLILMVFEHFHHMPVRRSLYSLRQDVRVEVDSVGYCVLFFHIEAYADAKIFLLALTQLNKRDTPFSAVVSGRQENTSIAFCKSHTNTG
jgi:hypothetical protein